MVGFGDFGSDVGEYASKAGVDFNHEWYSVNPGEYESRMKRDATNWLNEKRKEEAKKKAELLKKRLAEEYAKYGEDSKIKLSDFQGWADQIIEQSNQQYEGLQSSVDGIRNTYNSQIQQQAESQRQSELDRKLQLQKKQTRQDDALDHVGQYQKETQRLYEDFHNNKWQNQGGRFRDQFEDLSRGAVQALETAKGSDDPEAVKRVGNRAGYDYNVASDSLFQEWQRTRNESNRLIDQERVASGKQFGNFKKQAKSGAERVDKIDQGNLSELGLAELAGAFKSSYNEESAGWKEQAKSARANQRSIFDRLSNEANYPTTGYESRRDKQLSNSKLYGYAPSVYVPNLSGIQNQWQGLNPIIQQTIDQHNTTYGDWNQTRLGENVGEVQGTHGEAKDELTGQTQSFMSQIPGLMSSLRGGMLNEGALAGARSSTSNVNQQIGQYEQGMLSGISNYYNVFSDYLNQAKNQFQEWKSFRLNERSQLQGQNAQRESVRRGNQVIDNQASQVTKQRRNVGQAGGNSEEQQQLLSLLSRGNY